MTQVFNPPPGRPLPQRHFVMRWKRTQRIFVGCYKVYPDSPYVMSNRKIVLFRPSAHQLQPSYQTLHARHLSRRREQLGQEHLSIQTKHWGMTAHLKCDTVSRTRGSSPQSTKSCRIESLRSTSLPPSIVRLTFVFWTNLQQPV